MITKAWPRHLLCPRYTIKLFWNSDCFCFDAKFLGLVLVAAWLATTTPPATTNVQTPPAVTAEVGLGNTNPSLRRALIPQRDVNPDAALCLSYVN